MKYKKGTFVVVPNLEILEGEKTELQTIFMWLCSYADDDGQCFPSRNAIAKKCGITTKTLDKYIATLIELKLIQKTIRKKVGTKENTSNLYQICVIDTLPPENEIILPSVSVTTTPSHPNNPVTIPNINNTNLTITEEVKDTDKITLPLVKADGTSTGKNPTDRLLFLYSKLYFKMYSVYYKANWGMDKKIFNDMLKNYTEVQIAYLLCIYFDWHGMSGSDSKEYNFVTGATFPIRMFKSMSGKFEVYIRNVLNHKFDDDKDILNRVGEFLKQ